MQARAKNKYIGRPFAADDRFGVVTGLAMPSAKTVAIGQICQRIFNGQHDEAIAWLRHVVWHAHVGKEWMQSGAFEREYIKKFEQETQIIVTTRMFYLYNVVGDEQEFFTQKASTMRMKDIEFCDPSEIILMISESGLSQESRKKLLKEFLELL